MSYAEAKRLFRAALAPLRDHCLKERGRIDPTNDKHEFRFRHVQTVEAALEQAVNYGKNADRLIHPDPSPRNAAFIDAMRLRLSNQAAIQADPQLARNTFSLHPCPTTGTP